MTILGTLAGTAVVSLLLTHRSLTDCLAIGSGFGYYSLSSIFITEYRGAELGTIALLANITAGSHLGRRRHHDGHHPAGHRSDGRTRTGRGVHLPRICGGLQRPVSGDAVL